MKKLLVLLIPFLLIACTKVDQGNLLITFVEKEKDVEPFQTRMIVTKNFLRIDDGEGSANFILFDRYKRVIYSAEADEATVMAVHEKILKPGEKLEPPFKLSHSVKVLKSMEDAPEINGKSPVHYQLLTNNEICYDVIAAQGLLPDAVKALKEYHEVLATDSVTTFNNIPADLHNECDMTQSTFRPVRHLQFGFPIKEWGKREYVRTLTDYKTNYQVDDSLFEFPAGYKHYTVQELREGRVSNVGGH